MAKKTMLEQAQKAYRKGKEVRKKQKKRKVVTSERPQQQKPQKPAPKKEQKSAPKVPNRVSGYKPQQKSPVTPKTDLQQKYKQFQAARPKTTKTTVTKPKITKTTVSNPASRGTKGVMVGGSKLKNPFEKPKNYDYKKDLQQAAKKGLNTTYLGTKQKETTTKLMSDKKQKELYKKQVAEAKEKTYSSKEWAKTKETLKKQNNKGWMDYLTKDLGIPKDRAKEWLKSEEGTKYRKETYFAAKKDTVDSINKDIKSSIKKDIKSTYNLKSVNALTKQQSQQMQTATRMGKEMGNKYLKNVGGDKLLETIGSKTAESGFKGKFITGALQGSGFADVYSGSVGKYNKASKEAIRQTKGSKAYLGGYVGGLVGGFGITQTTAAGKALATAGLKGGAKTASKEVGKGLGKQFAKNRAGELAASTPLNVSDAVKMSMDENGKVDKKKFAEFMALNTVLTGAVGGAIEGAGMKKASSNVKKLTELMGKQRAGTITDKELEQLTKVRNKVRSSAKKANSLSGEISAKGLQDIKNAASEERLARAGGAAAAGKEAPSGFGVNKSRGQGQYTEAARQKSYNARMDRARESAERARAAQTHADGAAASAARSRETEIVRLQDKADDLRRQLAKADDAVTKDNTMLGHETAVRTQERIQKQLDHTEEMIRNAEAGTYNGRVKANIKAQRTNGTMLGHETAVREGEALQAEGRARAAAAFADDAAETAAKGADDVVEEVAETAEQKAIKSLDNEIAKSEETLKKLSDPDDVADLRAHIDELKAERDTHLTDRQIKERALNEAQSKVDDLRAREQTAKDALEDAKFLARGEDDAAVSVAQKNLDDIKAQREAAEGELREAHDAMEYTRLGDEYLEEVGLAVRETNEAGEKLTEAEIEAQKLGTMKEDLAQIDDSIADAQRRLAEATGDNVGVIRKELEALRQQRIVVANAIENNPSRQALMQAADSIEKAVTKKKTGLGQLIAKTNRAFVDSFGDWEKVFRSFDDPKLRDEAFAKLQKLRMSRHQAASKVFDEYLDLYEKFGLVGRKNKQKLADFEKYTFLQHELERIDDGTGFTGMAREDVESQIEALEKAYGEDIKGFQGEVVKYFDELLERDVQSGFETAERAAELRARFKNYIPTFRDSDGLDALSRAKPYEEIDFHRVHAAVGGDAWDVLPLHKQAMQKTQATLIRENENDLVSFVADIAQVNKKGLISGKTPQEYLESTTMTIKDPKTGKYSIAYFENGEKKSLQISEGMYKGIRQWTGEDRLFFMNSKLINTVTGKINRWFKDWITDYSLIFGARNFIRDIETGLFYSSHPLRYAKNIPRAISCVLADTPAGKAIIEGKGPFKGLPESYREYVRQGQMLTNAYKANGGRMGQLVSESDPYKLLQRLHRKSGPLAVIREINSTIETIPRMAEFASSAEEAALKTSGVSKEGWAKLTPAAKRQWLNAAVSDKKILASSMNRAKEITLNFDRSGYIGRWLNNTFVPFFNPAVQGADKLTRVLARDNHTAADFAKMVVMFGVIGQGTELLLNHVYADNESYKRLTDYEKTGYYHIPMEVFGGDKDSFLKIPRAREVAAVQGPLDWYLQHVKYQCAGKDENLFRSFKSNAKIWYEQIGPVSPISDNIFYTPYRIGKKGETWYGGYIEDFDEQELVKQGKSDQVWDENTTSVAKAINQMILHGEDKLKFLGVSDAQIKNMKTHTWSPKKIDDLLDSYMGVIYDMGIKNTSMKNPAMTEAIGDMKNGSYGEGTLGLGHIFTSSFASAFAVDSVMSNAYRSNQYARKADLQAQLDKMTKGLEEGSEEYNKVIHSKEYMKTNATMRRLNQSFAYTSVNYDSMMSNIYLRPDMSTETKNYWAKQIKKQQNSLLYGRQQGDEVANADPMKWGYNAKRKDGSRLFTNDELVDLCSFTYNDGGNATKESWDRYKKLNPKDKSGKSYFDILLGSREVNRATGESLSMVQYNVNAYVIGSQKRKTGKTYEKTTEAFEPFGNDTLKKEIDRADNYYGSGGNIGEYKQSHRAVVQGGIDLNLATYGGKDKGMESWDIMNSIARGRTKSGKRFNDRAYYAEGKYVSQRMNAARCLASDKYKDIGVDTESVNSFCKKHDFSYKGGDKSTYPKPEEVESAIRKDYKGKPAEVMAAVFEEICGRWVDNPFGKIGDYSQDDDTGITDLDNGGWGHGRRRGHRRGGWHGWGGGGGGGGSAAAPEPNTAGKNAKITKIKVHDYSKKSNLNEAYRKKLKKLREETRKYNT